METIMSEILHINDETFDQTVNSDTTVFVDLGALVRSLPHARPAP